ncbi:hypothetical protein OPV22_027006 [Ensete ventricosum]|uniref:Alkyl transferase n=1 Tax=Ensete ventricosum TaxID=4639 RepID=A0AAV8Q6B4_ENSVE|nr:hypothetical protein OPV22_027006 [Ensete ventricosum]
MFRIKSVGIRSEIHTLFRYTPHLPTIVIGGVEAITVGPVAKSREVEVRVKSNFFLVTGYRALEKIIDLSSLWGIRALTVFAFSSENWRLRFLRLLCAESEHRRFLEVAYFEGFMFAMNLLLFFQKQPSTSDQTVKIYKDCHWEGIRVCIISDSSDLPQSLQKLVKEVVDLTKNNAQIDLIIAISYSGRRDITQACQTIAQKVKHGFLEPEDIAESHIAEELETNCIVEFPYPDLLIRTSGELRLSNFLLWQSAYTELFFTIKYWPDFGEADYMVALCSFQSRQRSFGQQVA